MAQSDTKDLISHQTTSCDVDAASDLLRKSIQLRGDLSHVSVDEQLTLVDQLLQFELGRFLILNRGMNGYWTHYVCTHPMGQAQRHSKKLSHLEFFLLEKRPTALATQERFQIFRKLNQESVRQDACLVSVPSGLLGELLYLDYRSVSNIQILGIDLDLESLRLSQELALDRKLEQFVSTRQQDAWLLEDKGQFDLISSSGLTIYEADKGRLIDLFTRFYQALKPEGKLVTSFRTPPPGSELDACEWDFKFINQDDLRLQKVVFSDILDVKWQCYRTENEMLEILEGVGFREMSLTYDKARLFPTVVAFK